MNKYRLIKTNPLGLVTAKSVQGYPTTRIGDPTLFNFPDGYKYVIEEPFPVDLPVPGKRWVPKLTEDVYGWEQIDDIPQVVSGVAEATKLTLMRNLLAIDKWEIFKGALSTLDPISQQAWDLALTIKTNDPVVVQYKEPLMQALEINEEQFFALFIPIKDDDIF